MEINIYSVYDEKADRWDTPFHSLNDIFAERHFIMLTQKKGSMLNTFKSDFILYRLGTFDLSTGQTKTFPKTRILDGKQIMRKENSENENEISNET